MTVSGHRPVMAFVRLSRPWFLLGPALLLFVGIADAGAVEAGRLVPGLVMVWAAQLTAHYVNEYADVEADRLVTSRTPFSGGSGVLVTGDLPPVVALRAAWSTTAVAVLAVAWVAGFAWRAALAGVVAVGVSWAYSMPPVRLLSTGWGELVTSVTVAGVVPFTGVLLMEGTPSSDLWWLIVSAVAAHLAMMLIFELPDLASDRAAGKLVLGARLGETRTFVTIASVHVAGLVVGVSTLGPSPLWVVATLAAVASWVTCRRHALAANVAGIAVLVATGAAGILAVG